MAAALAAGMQCLNHERAQTCHTSAVTAAAAEQPLFLYSLSTIPPPVPVSTVATYLACALCTLIVLAPPDMHSFTSSSTRLEGLPATRGAFVYCVVCRFSTPRVRRAVLACSMLPCTCTAAELASMYGVKNNAAALWGWLCAAQGASACVPQCCAGRVPQAAVCRCRVPLAVLTIDS